LSQKVQITCNDAVLRGSFSLSTELSCVCVNSRIDVLLLLFIYLAGIPCVYGYCPAGHPKQTDNSIKRGASRLTPFALFFLPVFN